MKASIWFLNKKLIRITCSTEQNKILEFIFIYITFYQPWPFCGKHPDKQDLIIEIIVPVLMMYCSPINQFLSYFFK